MRRFALVLWTLAVAGLCGCAGAYVAGDAGAASADSHRPLH
jgi:hypothetical protein